MANTMPELPFELPPDFADCGSTLIEKNLIYGMLTLPSNMFYTVTLPATLWFFDKAKDDDRSLFVELATIASKGTKMPRAD